MIPRLPGLNLKSLLFSTDTAQWGDIGRNFRDRDEGCAFTVGIRFNQELGFLEVLSFWGEGVGAAIYLFAILSNNLFLALSGLLFVVVAIVALVAHLGKAVRAWRVTTNLATAWVSRGPVIMAGFVGAGIIWSYLSFVDRPGLYRSIAFLVSFCAAVLLMFYAAWLLRSMKVIKLWHGILFPMTFVSHAITSGLVILACLNWTVSNASSVNLLYPQIACASLALCLFLTVMHLRRSENSPAVYASLVRLADGDLRGMFVGGAIVLGMVVPFFLITFCVWWRDFIPDEFKVALAVLTIASRLVGDLAYRYAVVQAGAYESILSTGKRG